MNLSVRVDAARATATLRGLGDGARAFAGLSARVGARPDIAPHARYVVEGTRPHDILPRHKKALWWEGARHPVRRVRHPGTRPNPFNVEALRVMAPMGRKLILDALAAVAGGNAAPGVIPAAFRAWVERTRQEMVGRAPRGRGERAGRLRESITEVYGR